MFTWSWPAQMKAVNYEKIRLAWKLGTSPVSRFKSPGEVNIYHWHGDYWARTRVIMNIDTFSTINECVNCRKIAPPISDIKTAHMKVKGLIHVRNSAGKR